MSDIEVFYNGKRFKPGDTIPFEDIKATGFAFPIVKQKVPDNFMCEPVGGLKKRSLLKALWDNPGIRIAILTPFVVALLMILEQYGLLPYQW